MPSLGRRTHLRTAALARVTFALIALLLVSKRYAKAEETGKNICKKACDETAVAESLKGASLTEGGQAGAVIVACHLSCEFGKHADPRTRYRAPRKVSNHTNESQLPMTA